MTYAFHQNFWGIGPLDFKVTVDHMVVWAFGKNGHLVQTYGVNDDNSIIPTGDCWD